MQSFVSQADGVTLHNLVLRGGATLTNATNVTLRGNTVSGASNYGIEVTSSIATVTGNTVSGNLVGIYITTPYSPGTVIENNRLLNNTSIGFENDGNGYANFINNTLVQAGGVRQFQFDGRDLAMMCASHNGEDMHVAQTQTMLEKTGLTYKALRCGCHVPGLFTLLDQAPPAGLQFDERHNNCSGKHAGFLAYCVQHGLSLDDYIDPAHPLQAAVRRDVARAVGMDANDFKMGLDGCSAPNYALPLDRLAYGYARLASGARDAEFGPSFAALSAAMTAHPDLVSGTKRNDLAFMQAGRGDWVSKVGADGVQVVGSTTRGEAFAIKVIDGNRDQMSVSADVFSALDES